MTDTDQPNEILQSVADAKARETAGASKGEERARERRWQLGRLGLGVGIGSAAVAAAVLYANRRKD